MTGRLPCRTSGCQATILPATAAKTGGICMPCHQRKLALEEQRYIEQNRKEVDLYAGISDPVQILIIMHQPRKYNPLEQILPYRQTARELYHQLTDRQQEQMENYALTLVEEADFDRAETILLSLACYTDAPVERGLKAFFRAGIYYPGILYRQAGPVIRDRLIQLIEHDAGNRNHLLLALAWIGDEEVVKLFKSWRQQPPDWADGMYQPPENYAREAGWELDAAGGKKLLFHPESYSFIADREHTGEPEVHPAVSVLHSSNEVCPWCSGRLTVLLDYNLQDPLLQFMKLSGRRLRIAACMQCNCYGTVYMKVDLDGGYVWSEYNTVPDYLPHYEEGEGREQLEWNTLTLSDRPTGTYENSHWTLETPASQIGGHPAWIQDADYPECPCCLETMKFIAQIDMEQADDSEGIYYAFLCGTCLIAAVNYQQT
ncbi:DUF1963 domain-containing protein [Paenibacillus sp. PK3_47]|uniref:DUF1963 domain-containing protein n=1 Tax=Paenibacillus sp. PK3_47 TaxID=2072642 RepID=UPI00201D3CB0|nr:DUF1963 domain-containing protein [Paenibacillus sp. PK3_47]UQZ35542.1 DUF1963 domain-containing protein [Paenibacillus sp. PK3_47]